MNVCQFCKRNDFPSQQSFYAHLRWCSEYLKHKHKQSTASLRQAVPKAQPTQGASPLTLSHTSFYLNDPLAPSMDFSQGLREQLGHVRDPQESTLQRRRKLLQTAKSKVVDYCCWAMGTVTTEMRAAAKLAIERELRDEPLEEFAPQEVDQLAEGIRDRVYDSFLRRKEKDARRIQDEAQRNHTNQCNDDRKYTARIKRKAAYLDEGRRRAVNFLKTRSLSPLKRVEALEEMLLLLDETLTGDEPVSEAYAALDAILGARATELNAQEAAKEAKHQREWRELATVIGVVIAVWILHAKSPEILQWFLNMFSSKRAENPGSTPHPTTESPQPYSEEHASPRPTRRRRRPSQSPPPESPSTPYANSGDNPFSS